MSKLMQSLVPELLSMIQSGGRSSAMKPMLSIGVVLFLAMVCMPSEVQIYNVPIKGLLGGAFCIYLIFAIRAYYKILEKDPKLLQSEHYQLAMRRMDIAVQRLGTPPDFLDITDVEQPQQESLPGSDAPKRILVNDAKDSVEGVAAKEAE